MTSQTRRCPKCNHEQTNQVECEACGLLFRKFDQAREREKERNLEAEANPDGPPRRTSLALGLGSAIALVAATAALTLLLTSGPSAPPEQPVAQQPAVAVSGEEPARPTGSSPPVHRTAPPRQSQPVDTSASIERAKNGTVAIETPWGKGSGFFITDTTIVTNRHVVEPDKAQIDEIRHKVTTGRQLITLEQEKIAELRSRTRNMEDGPTRRQLLIIIQEKERQLAQVLPAQEEVEARLKELEKPRSTGEIKIILADGSESAAQSTQVSARRDLALLSLYSAKAVVLKAVAKTGTLQQGAKVYTIGNPVGLRHTVTSGIFSGYRQHRDTGEIMLQTDAPINPGNSGGPLIDEQGQVHGVNTMIIQNTQGIGFAIPIQAVFEEFTLSPP